MSTSVVVKGGWPRQGLYFRTVGPAETDYTLIFWLTDEQAEAIIGSHTKIYRIHSDNSPTDKDLLSMIFVQESSLVACRKVLSTDYGVLGSVSGEVFDEMKRSGVVMIEKPGSVEDPTSVKVRDNILKEISELEKQIRSNLIKLLH